MGSGSPLNLASLGSGNGLSSVDGTVKNYRVFDGKAVKSLFSGGVGQFSPYPAQIDKASGNVIGMNNAAYVHNDFINELSISSIIQYCKNYTAMTLDYADFAYLKHIGVYPNNRLIIARRFASGVSNDLTAVGDNPLATLISWADLSGDDTDFISIKYNEVFDEAEANFERVLNDIGQDLKGSQDQTGAGGLGSMASRAFDILPFPGFMEGVLSQVMKEMGLTDHGWGNSPFGNPNIIAQARIRKTQDFKQGGSGLIGKFNVKMVVEYEQKFINGVDPTLVYFDIIQNALSFGTSDAAFRFNSAFAEGTSDILKKLSSGDVKAVYSAVVSFVKSLMNAILNVIDDIWDAFSAATNQNEDDWTKEEGFGGENSLTLTGVKEVFRKAISVTFGHVVAKYKIRIIGIANSMTGSPSTPWHITIGNPKKPIFSSGDMECTEVSLSLGKVLAFNDLPSTVKLEINFTSARNLGAQEIFNRFNTGRGRSYARTKLSFNEHPDPVFPEEGITSKYIDPNKGTSASSNTPSTGTGSFFEKKEMLSTGDPKPATYVDDYIIKDTSPTQLGGFDGLGQPLQPAPKNTGTGWLNYSGPQISQVVNNTAPNVQNNPPNNLSGQSSTSNTTGRNLNGVNVPTSGTASPSGSTGLGPVGASPSVPPGASPSVPPPLTPEQKKAERDKLTAELEQLKQQLNTTPEKTEVSVELRLGNSRLAILPWNDGKFKDTDAYKNNYRPLNPTEIPIIGPNPKYEDLLKKKTELEKKIKNLES